MNKRRLALITGWSLIMMAIIAGFSVGYAFSEFNQPDQVDILKENIMINKGLYQGMLIGILIILILDVLVSYTLYKYFKDDNENISLISGGIRIIYTLVFGVASIYLAKNLNVTELTNQTIASNFQVFQTIWNAGLVIFGFHIFLIGLLMKIHKTIPKILWYLAFIAGVSYVILHLVKLIGPDTELANMLGMILTIPMTIGELGLAVWLVVRGGKVTMKKNH